MKQPECFPKRCESLHSMNKLTLYKPALSAMITDKGLAAESALPPVGRGPAGPGGPGGPGGPVCPAHITQQLSRTNCSLHMSA